MISIKLMTGSHREKKVRDQLRTLLRKYDLQKWLFTQEIRIEEGAIPHSHPVLTLNTCHLNNEVLLLAIFLHEQLHWFLETQKTKTAQAIADLKRLYPKVPVEPPEGAWDESSTYLHLIVCYLKYQALTELLGSEEANRVLKCHDHYRWIYATILRDHERIGTLIARYSLEPQ